MNALYSTLKLNAGDICNTDMVCCGIRHHSDFLTSGQGLDVRFIVIELHSFVHLDAALFFIIVTTRAFKCAIRVAINVRVEHIEDDLAPGSPHRASG